MKHEELSLKDLLRQFWRAKFYMIVFMMLAGLVAFAFITLSVPKYKATMIVAPADGYALGDYASKIQYDRIAALPFWRPKDQEGASTDFYRFIHTMRGSSASNILIQDKAFLHGVNKNLKDKITSPEELAKYLSKKLRIDPLGATPLRKMSYYHSDKEFAVAMLRKIHLVADQMIRRDRRQQSQSRIEYLENSMKRTLNPDHRKVITNLLMQQEHVQMLANLDEAYAAIVVEPSSHSPEPVWPNKPLVYFVALFCGFFIGFMMWNLMRNENGDRVD
jgi:LPS O-antigen subunit length determinant protein (WzzB/FepE family)